MLYTCKNNTWKLQFLQRSVSFNRHLGWAAWAPRSGLFGGSAAVAWRHHVTWHRWVLRGLKISVAMYEIDVIFLWSSQESSFCSDFIDGVSTTIPENNMFLWFVLRKIPRFQASSPKGHCGFAQCFGASPLLPEQSRRLGRSGWCRVSVVALGPPNFKDLRNPLWNTCIHIMPSCIGMYHSFIVQIAVASGEVTPKGGLHKELDLFPGNPDWYFIWIFDM